MFAFIEVLQDEKWVLGEPMELDTDCDNQIYIPRNMAPPWGYDNIMYYYEMSGERGLPKDICSELRKHVLEDWDNDVYSASWFTLAEIKQLYSEGQPSTYCHFNIEWFSNFQTCPDEAIRVVFWRN
ncbi:MAG: hypothetical protein O2890_13750 [Cyanobacteria bacterium]|nr:hypothetical protein [Cyanobacteriota bacterium]MDA0867443.1 hypothetical protein [Cyanobacteriota bacterium]